ncbi:MAG: DUF4124 domain-containing protein [Halothiobacillus sp.]
MSRRLSFWGLSRLAGVCLCVGVFSRVVLAEAATVYQCKDKNGLVIFSGSPCGADAKTRVIDAPNAGTGGDNQGINSLAKQYDQRREREAKEAAKTARAQVAAQAAEAARPKYFQPPLILDNTYGGYPVPGYYPGSGSMGTSWWVNGGTGGWSIGAGSYPLPYQHNPAPPEPYVYKDPGISGQFPGGAPGSTGSNFHRK